MTKDINDFITIIRQKNGQVKITHTPNNVCNIYKYIYELGYRNSKLGKKRIYFLRNGTNVTPVNFWDIKDDFFERFKKFDFTNIPKDIEYASILNCYYRRQPIKENEVFKNYPDEILTKAQIHNFMLIRDPFYKHRFEVKELLSKLDEWAFHRTVDTIGAFTTKSPLYFKNVGGQKYLIFTYYNPNHESNDGFDSWIATFSSQNHIGNKMPLEVEKIQLSFHLERDFHLIKDFIK